MLQYFTLNMKTKNGKELYMMAEGKEFKWTFNKQDAIWFKLPQDVKKFANSHFKEFNNWYVGEVKSNC